ncbi:Renalase [Orchesella cincta]|uniref:Renalase n=1 Tax=Orchesella cincta TaxID=48709 RepID=A0A1D2N8Q8_ORCCI|nr:Renalase [Orchesella cincta]
MNAKKRLLLIGAGPTSSLISYNIAKNAKLKNAVDIHVFEKSRGIGGRFSTSRSTKNPDCLADLGAQYLTQNQSNQSMKPYFDTLTQHNLVRPLETSSIPGFRAAPKKSHYACVNGTSSIVKHFFEQAAVKKADIVFDCRVIKISPAASGKVEVTTEKQGIDTFDLVISTMPVPQILQLENSSELISDLDMKRNLSMVKYSTRFALGLFFDDEIRLASSTQPLNFIENDTVLRYWSIENVKRTGSFSGPTSVVVHTSIQYGAANVDVDNLKPQLFEKAVSIIPEAASIPNDSVKSHKWRYSQVLESYAGKPGCINLKDSIFAAGDGFSESGFEGCIYSAEKAVSAIEAALNL